MIVSPFISASGGLLNGKDGADVPLTWVIFSGAKIYMGGHKIGNSYMSGHIFEELSFFQLSHG